MTLTDYDTMGPELAGVNGTETDDGPRLYCSEDGCDYSAAPGPRQGAALARHRTRSHGPEPRGYAVPAAEEGDEDPGGNAPPAGEPAPRERVPAPAASTRGKFWQGWRDRIRRPTEERAAGSGAPPKTRPARPKLTGRRVSVAADISDLYQDIGRRAEYTAYYPVGRLLTYQAPAAGVIWDDLVAGTRVDRFLVQPVARNKETVETVAFLAAPPVLMFTIQNAAIAKQQAIERGDEAEANRLDGWIRMEMGSLAWILRRSILRLAPAMAEARERQAKEDELIREAFPGLHPDVDPVQALLSSLFAPPGAPSPQPEEDPYVGETV